MTEQYRTSVMLDAESNRRIDILAEKTGETKATILRAVIRAGLMTLPNDWGIAVDWSEDNTTERALNVFLGSMRDIMVLAAQHDSTRQHALPQQQQQAALPPEAPKKK